MIQTCSFEYQKLDTNHYSWLGISDVSYFEHFSVHMCHKSLCLGVRMLVSVYRLYMHVCVYSVCEGYKWPRLLRAQMGRGHMTG